MAVKLEVPSVGESVSEGTLSRWLKPSGSPVKANEIVCEIETDKAMTEVSAPVAGTLVTLVAVGQKVAVGAVIGRIEDGVPSTSALPAASAPSSSASAATPPLALPVDSSPATPPTPTTAPSQLTSVASPAARQLAADKGIDLTQVSGTGRDGRIIKEDVQAQLQPQQPQQPQLTPDHPSSGIPTIATIATIATLLPASVTPTPTPDTSSSNTGPRETRQQMSTIRQRIAERLLSAQQNAAILTTFNEADLSGVMALRAKYKESFQKKYGVGLGFMGFFIKASVEALRAFPVVNARIDGQDIVYQHFYDLGVAVSTEKGLMVPVLRGCDRLTFADIEKKIIDLANRARDGKIVVSDLQGGTFTITNGGIFGSMMSTPILNPPQSAILGMHAIQKRAVVVEDQIVIRPMMYLALSYDHRIIDGREAVSFLVRIKECIEAPERLLLEV